MLANGICLCLKEPWKIHSEHFTKLFLLVSLIWWKTISHHNFSNSGCDCVLVIKANRVNISNKNKNLAVFLFWCLLLTSLEHLENKGCVKLVCWYFTGVSYIDCDFGSMWKYCGGGWLLENCCSNFVLGGASVRGLDMDLISPPHKKDMNNFILVCLLGTWKHI